jgi:hypothetical protein
MKGRSLSTLFCLYINQVSPFFVVMTLNIVKLHNVSYIIIIIIIVELRPNAGNGLLILEVARSHIATHHIR